MTRLATSLFVLAAAIAPAATALAQATPQMQAAPNADGAAAQGIVVGPGDKPQAGVPVQIIGPPGQTVAITDKNGTWSVYNLPAGNYKVKPLSGEQTTATQPVTFSVKEKTFFEKITGSVKDVIKSPDIKVEPR
jgi:hypothetical protein